MNLYVTADRVGQPDHGGGSVTFHESAALKTLGPCEVWDREELNTYTNRPLPEEPWRWDRAANLKLCLPLKSFPSLLHFYAGTFSETIARCKRAGSKITYTAAAHDIEVSKREHEKLGIPFLYPHLTDPKIWKRYVQGYLDADVVICPSTHSANCMESYGCKNIKIIPHGVDLPDEPPKPLPKQFTVGYLGSVSAPDKGVIYLLQAWRKLNYADAMLLLAGYDSTSSFVQKLVREYGGGCIALMGWQRFTGDFYNRLSCYIQPSASEGFGIETLEAMAHNRPVLCSDGAGSADVVPKGHIFPAMNSDILADMIDDLRDELPSTPFDWRGMAEQYMWNKIRPQYVDLWRGLLV